MLIFGCGPIQLLRGSERINRGAACMLAEHSRGVRCTVLSQVALATPEVAAAERRSAHLLIHDSPERSGEATPG